jgi:hypothetical protein
MMNKLWIALFVTLVGADVVTGHIGNRLSARPFELHLNRISAKTSQPVDSNSRTRPEFFENALGLYPGHMFGIDRQRWNRIQSSKLFSNLTADAVVQDDTTMRVFVSGNELPSRILTPEVSARMEGTTPVVDGTIRYVDKNFNGLGQRLMLALAGREKVTSKTAAFQDLSTDPIHECEWEDWSTEGERIMVGCKRDYCVGKAHRLMSVRTSAHRLMADEWALSSDNRDTKISLNTGFVKLSRSISIVLMYFWGLTERVQATIFDIVHRCGLVA